MRQFGAHINWWLTGAEISNPVQFLEGVSSEEYVHEIELLKFEILDVGKKALSYWEEYKETEKVLSYIAKFYPDNSKMHYLYGVYYHCRARLETHGVPLHGPYVQLAEESFAKAVTLNPSDPMNHMALIHLYYLCEDREQKIREAINKIPKPIPSKVSDFLTRFGIQF